MKKPVLFLLAVLALVGCGRQEKSVEVQAPVHQASDSAIKVVIDPVNPETQSYETADANIGPSPAGSGATPRKIATQKMMGAGKIFNVYTDAKAPDNHYIP